MRKKKVNVIIHFNDEKISQKDAHMNHVKFFLLLSEIKLENDLNENKITHAEYETQLKQYKFMINYIDEI